jgi:prolyl-tRNA editing enzyme YbaK/EbsC (Cys-tRNA(Pro) deacylase)
MQLGNLCFRPVSEDFASVASSTQHTIQELNLHDVHVSEIDETVSDTAAFCERYNIGLDISANCVIVEAKRAGIVRYAACMILATTKADVNGAVRRQLDTRKISFAPMDTATALTSMQYGGITPIGLPADWPILIDSQVDATDTIIIGSGLRKSKILVPGKLLASLPHAIVLDIAKG